MIPESQKRAVAKYQAAHPEKVKEAKTRYEAKRGKRDRAEYMKEYRRRKKAEKSDRPLRRSPNCKFQKDPIQRLGVGRSPFIQCTKKTALLEAIAN
jgi:hypothetical protein